MQNILAVFLGGGLGATLRFFVSLLFAENHKINFPISTFSVNIIGCFILGFLYFYFINKPEINSNIKMLLTVGFCGGLTTFSTFSLEIFEMIRTANYLTLASYIILSIVMGIFAVWLGVCCARIL